MTPPKAPVSLWPDPQALGTLTDLYELTMMAGYAASGLDRVPSTFELFVRRLPPNRSYLIFAGLEQAIGALLDLRFSNEQVDYLRNLPAFADVDPAWFDGLADFRFEGDVWAIPEGSVVFPGETLLRVEGSLAQSQWVETLLLAMLGYPTLVASKAARIVDSAGERSLFEFGARRGHGPHASFLAARSSYLAGFTGTSQTEAARLLGIPVFGTMAHSWVQSFPSESEAFAAFVQSFPNNSTLLVDTYDTPEGVRQAAAIEPPAQAIRLDSGDLGALAKESRAILDAHNRPKTRIFASGDLDEYKVAALIGQGAPIDGFGIGTELTTSRDAPALSMVYKLVAVEGQGRAKLSPGKRTYPLAKQVWRRRDGQGRFTGDHVTQANESSEGEPLLVPILRDGQLVRVLPSLDQIREHCRSQCAALPDRLRVLEGQAPYPVTYSDLLEEEAERLGLLP